MTVDELAKAIGAEVTGDGSLSLMSCATLDEAGPGQDLELHPSLRYAHSRGYIQDLASRNGFEIVHTEAHPIREDQRVAIPGLFAWLVKR